MKKHLILPALWLLAAFAVAPSFAQTWTKIADEGQFFSAEAPVRYGKAPTWIERPVSGAGQCTNGFFGSDPVPNVAKTCEVRSTPTPPPVAGPLPAPSCWPAQFVGSGTPARVLTVKPSDALPLAPAPVDAVEHTGALWHCMEAGQWRAQFVWCESSKLPECAARVTLASVAGLSAAWANNPPRAADASNAWVAAVLRSRALAIAPAASAPASAPTPTVERWVVATAPANASPPGTRPGYTYIAPATLVADYTRVPQGTACDCAKTSYQQSSNTRYCNVGTPDARVAVCVRAP